MIKLFFQILGIVFFILIIQFLRAYFTTKNGECKSLGISYFPLNTIKVCRGEQSVTPTITATT